MHDKNISEKNEGFKAKLGDIPSTTDTADKENTREVASDVNIFTCNLCIKSFRRKQHLKEHIQMKHTDQRFSCNECDFEAKMSHGLKRHIRIVHQGFKVKCDQCSFETCEISRLNNHKRRKHEMLNFHCDVCDLSVKNKYLYQLHIKEEHKGNNPNKDTNH